jgi:hypothetical protein
MRATLNGKKDNITCGDGQDDEVFFDQYDDVDFSTCEHPHLG